MGKPSRFERHVRTVRGILIERLESHYLLIEPRIRDRLKDIIVLAHREEHGTLREVVEQFLYDMLHDIQVAMFPEEFLEPGETLGKSMLNNRCYRGINSSSLSDFAKSMKSPKP